MLIFSALKRKSNCDERKERKDGKAEMRKTSQSYNLL